MAFCCDSMDVRERNLVVLKILYVQREPILQLSLRFRRLG